MSESESTADPTLCHRCGAILHPGRGDFFVVKIEAMSDPSPPILSARDVAGAAGVSLADLAREMEEFSEQELMDYVYRKLTLTLCMACYKQWIENPTGTQT